MKTSVENYIFWCEIGSWFEEPGGTVPPRIPRSTPHPKQNPPFHFSSCSPIITRNSLKSSSNLWRCGALNNIEFNYGKPESKEKFFLPLTNWYNALSVLTATTTYIFLTAKNSCLQSGHGQLTMFNIHKWTLPLEIVLAWSDEKWVFSKNIRKVWQTEHVNKPGNMLSSLILW